MKLGYGGRFKIFIGFLGRFGEWADVVRDGSAIKLIIDNCRKGEEEHVYIEHSADEPLGLIVGKFRQKRWTS